LCGTVETERDKLNSREQGERQR